MNVLASSSFILLLDQQLGKEQKEHWMDKLQQLHGVRGPKQLLFLVQARIKIDMIFLIKGVRSGHPSFLWGLY